MFLITVALLVGVYWYYRPRVEITNARGVYLFYGHEHRDYIYLFRL